MDAIVRPGALAEPAGLSDGVVRLRSWSYDDLACVEEASEDAAIISSTTVPHPFTDVEGRAFVERQWGRAAAGEGVSLALVDMSSGLAVGLVCLLHRQQPGVVGLGYWLVVSRRGQGLARRGVDLLARWALNLSCVDRVEALVDPSNRASSSVLEGAGFQLEATLRAYFVGDGRRSDALLYSLISADLSVGPPPPTSG